MSAPVPGESMGNVSRDPAGCSLPSMNRPRTGFASAFDTAFFVSGMFMTISLAGLANRSALRNRDTEANRVGRSVIYRSITIYSYEYNESNLGRSAGRRARPWSEQKGERNV